MKGRALRNSDEQAEVASVSEIPRVRILHVVATAQRRGAEVFAADLIGALADTRADQHVAVIRDHGLSPVRYPAETTALRSRERRMPGLRVDLGAARRLRDIVRDWRPHLVQAHGGEAFKYSMLARSGAPVVYRRIGLADPRISSGASRAAHGWLMRRSARIVAVAEAIRQETVETFSVSPTKVMTIPQGVDPARLAPSATRKEVRARLGIAIAVPVSCSIGALSTEKDPAAQLDAVERIVAEEPTAVHLFIGDGPLRVQLEAAIRERGLAERTRVLGTRVDIGDLLCASDVLFLTSRSEGMPACLIEAGIAGLPVVAFEIAGVPEAVKAGRTGLLVPPGATELLASSVIGLLRKPDTRHSMGREAREWCLSRFSMAAIRDRFLDLYRELADVRRSTGVGNIRPTAEDKESRQA